MNLTSKLLETNFFVTNTKVEWIIPPRNSRSGVWHSWRQEGVPLGKGKGNSKQRTQSQGASFSVSKKLTNKIKEKIKMQRKNRRMQYAQVSKLQNDKRAYCSTHIGVCVYFNVCCNILVLQLSVNISQKQITFLRSWWSNNLQKDMEDYLTNQF